jgi:hypothetical protein
LLATHKREIKNISTHIAHGLKPSNKPMIVVKPNKESCSKSTVPKNGTLKPFPAVVFLFEIFDSRLVNSQRCFKN